MDLHLFGRLGVRRRARISGGRHHSGKSAMRQRRLTLESLELRTLLSAATINWATQEQTIAGFGSSSAWNNLGSLDGSQQQLLWSTTNGAGLSILRSKILSDTSSSSWEIDSMQKAQAMGVTIFSTPWGPPAAWKSNGNVADIVNGVATGGYLLSADYQNYANWLAQYVINMHNDGITVYAVSMQNEPDWQASYESCLWTAQQFHDVLSILHDTLASDATTYPYLANVKIILPEETHWDSLNLVSQVMSDPTESNYANIIYADHTYGDYSNNNPITGLNGHQIWETEHTGTDPSQGIQAGLDEATSIYHVVAQNQASAYVHWWTNAGGGAGLLGGNWQSTKLFSAMENYSKFIRPGWAQVGESDDGGLDISAYKNPNTGDFATVLVNTSSSAITETINLNGAYSPVLTPWVTSATLDVAQQQSIPALGNGGSYTYTIPAKSIVTLTGNATTTPVSEKPVGLLATAATTSSITLSWTNNLTGATGYTVQRSTNGTTWTTLSSSLSSSTFTYTDSGLPVNAPYYYRVQANTGTLDSNIVAEMTQPPAPTNLTASYNVSNQNVTLNWTKSGLSTTDYAVDVSTDGGVTWTTQTAGISSGSGSASYTDTSAPELTTLQYRVRAVYGSNSSVPTSVATVTTTVLKAPTGLSVMAGGSSAVLKWTDGTTTNSTVSVERSTDGTNWAVIASVNHGVQTYTNSPVTEGGTYYYRIRNYDGAATPPTYSAYATASAVTVPPAAPTHVEVVFSPSPTLMARVLWVNNSTSDTAYEVDRSGDGGNTWTTLTNALPANSTSYTDATVTGGQAYEYRVEALTNALPSTSVATLSETASALPAPYAHGDIGDAGTVGLAGSASYDFSTGTYTLNGAGADIWNAADGFHFSYTTLTGDGQISARVTSVSNTNVWAKAGLMFRNGTGADAAFADVVATPGSGVSFQWRATAGGTPGYAQVTGITAPVWLRLIRVGNQFSAYYSPDNVTWTQIGGSISIAMGTTVYRGMVACSHSSSQLAAATFTNVALTGTGNQAPTVATAAAASQLPPPNAATANLSVLGADDAGEGNLIYSWATSGTPPGAVVFSSNGQNASNSTVATFSAVGSYSFVVTITDQFGISTTSTVNLTVNQAVSRIVISPSGVTLAPNSQRQFTATAYDQFGAVFPTQPSFVWSSSNSNLGSINPATGLYSAGNLQGITEVTATAGAVSGSATVNVTTLPAPLAWYAMDATSGSTVADSSGHGYNGTATGSYSWTPGETSNALALGGGYATLPGAFATSLQSITNFTISGWVRLTSIGNWARLFDFGTGTNVYMFLAPADGNGYVRFAITTGGGGAEQQLTTTTTLATNTWTFLAVTLSGTTGTLYINGAAAKTNSSMTLNPSSLGNTSQDYLGKSQHGGDPTLQGSLDDVRIYNVGFSASQVTQLYDSYSPPTVATPAAANPPTVTGTTSTLSALGASSVNLPLTYTWSPIGTPPAPVMFSENGTNVAKSTVATFSKAGMYTLGVTIVDSYGQFATSSVAENVQQTLTGLSVSPSTANITGGVSQQFTATANDQFGQPMASQPTIAWTLLSGPGSLTGGGLYTPPYASGSATVQASAGGFVQTASASYAAQAQWNAASSSSWTTGGNWTDAFTSAILAAPGVRGLTGDTVFFASNMGPIATLDGANPTLAGITFNSATTSYTIAPGSGGTLQMNGGTSNASIQATAGSHSIAAQLSLLSNLTISAAAGSSLTISGAISGTGQSLTKTGAGTLTLSGANSFTGGTTVTGGSLVVESGASLGGSLAISGGSVVTIAASDANGNPLNSVATSNTSTAIDATTGSPQPVPPTAASVSAVAATSTLTSTAASSEPPMSVAVASSSHGSAGSALLVKSNSSDLAGLIALQSSNETGGVSALAYSVSDESERSSLLTNTGVPSTSDAATFLERETAVAANGNGELLHRDAVAAASADADVLEWAASTPASRPSTTDADISLLPDELLDAIGQHWMG